MKPLKHYPVTWKTRATRFLARVLFKAPKGQGVSATLWDRLPMGGRYTVFHALINGTFYALKGEVNHCENAHWREMVRHYPLPSEEPSAWLQSDIDLPMQSVLSDSLGTAPMTRRDENG